VPQRDPPLQALTRSVVNPPNLPCPCGSSLAYAACCGRYHAGAEHLAAPSAEALMRSRYSAFVLGLHAYLLQTWHASTRPTHLEPDPPGLKWLGLEVRRHHQSDSDHATVEFVARSKLGGRAQRLHEVSRFVRDGGRWTYLDGDRA
jgi:SEC-C motif domain protein